jgi:FAD-dependent oxidoreductase domain-containing protein 1
MKFAEARIWSGDTAKAWPAEEIRGRDNPGWGREMVDPYDVVIIGGGIMGSSIAYHLASDGLDGKVAVIEKDPTYQYSSTALSGGGIREQFSTEINIRISKYAMEVLKTFEDDMAVGDEAPSISFKNVGYLFLANSQSQMAVLKKNHIIQRRLGTDVVLLEPEEVSGICPEIYTGDVVGASFGKRDGILDPWGFLQGYLKKAKSLGVRYHHDEVTDIFVEASRVRGVRTKSGSTFHAPVIVLAAGPWNAAVGRMAGIALPIEPLRRQTFFFNSPRKVDKLLPLVIDGKGLVWRNETEIQFLASKFKKEERPGFNFAVDHEFFNEEIWPDMAQRVPLFNSLKLLRGYSGLYSVNTIDANAIIGEYPDIQGLYLAGGFSGHGLQQAPAVGKGLSELIRLQRYETIDLMPLRFERFEKDELVIEGSFLHEEI